MNNLYMIIFPWNKKELSPMFFEMTRFKFIVLTQPLSCKDLYLFYLDLFYPCYLPINHYQPWFMEITASSKNKIPLKNAKHIFPAWTISHALPIIARIETRFCVDCACSKNIAEFQMERFPVRTSKAVVRRSRQTARLLSTFDSTTDPSRTALP